MRDCLKIQLQPENRYPGVAALWDPQKGNLSPFYTSAPISTDVGYLGNLPVPSTTVSVWLVVGFLPKGAPEIATSLILLLISVN